MIPDRDAAQLPRADYLRQVPREDRLADKVADMLTRAVLDGQLRPGDRLPPERILGERLGVSRTVVREAIRSLAAKGLVEVRSGSGSVVASVDAARVVETVRLYVRGADVSPDAVAELWTTLAVRAAGLAAVRATDEDLRSMRAATSAMAEAAYEARDPDEYAAHDAAFHQCVARAAGNPLYLLLIEATTDVAATSRRVVANLQEEARSDLRCYERTVECIALRDASGASEQMRLHLAGVSRAWQEAIDAAGPPLPAELDPSL